MRRFTTGLILGAAVSGIAWAAGANPLVTAGLGLLMAVLAWTLT